MTHIEIEATGSEADFPDSLQVGDLVRIEATARVFAVEDALIDATPVGAEEATHVQGPRTLKLVAGKATFTLTKDEG